MPSRKLPCMPICFFIRQRMPILIFLLPLIDFLLFIIKSQAELIVVEFSLIATVTAMWYGFEHNLLRTVRVELAPDADGWPKIVLCVWVWGGPWCEGFGSNGNLQIRPSGVNLFSLQNSLTIGR